MMFAESRQHKRLGQNVRAVVLSATIGDLYFVTVNFLINEMMPDINMLGACMELIIICVCNRSLII